VARVYALRVLDKSFNLKLMTKPTVELRTKAGTLTVGEIPRVVGTLSNLDFRGAIPSDIVEVRLDRILRAENWLERCKRIQFSSGKPVLLTARLQAEGGFWRVDDEARRLVYSEALRDLAAVDVELSSAICVPVAAEAERLRKTCIVSFHDFHKTPPLKELCALVERAQSIGSIAKISTMVTGKQDVVILRSLLARPWPKPLCVIGMGAAWANTRVEFAKAGSCLTYGYLDGSAAPGQWHASELKRQLQAVN
jgi:3-dehydroquinate dehydratase-1